MNKQSIAFDEKDYVPCKWCGNPTRFLGTKECDGCWELRTRMEHNLKFATKMLEQLKKGG